MILSRKRTTNLLRSLLSAHQHGLLDGVVWGLMKTAEHDDLVPASVKVDGITHRIEDMRSGKHPVIRLLDHALQRAVLAHPSTQLFISHCGISSIYEALHAGVSILGLPEFGDQPSNAIKLVEHGTGLWIRRSAITEETLFDALHRLLLPNSEENRFFRMNAARLQQMIHIANRDHTRGPDLIELAAVPGAILAHESADWRMPWWKASNYDLYAFVIASILATGYLLVYTIHYADTLLRASQHKQKQA
jgi:hypothetical protein